MCLRVLKLLIAVKEWNNLITLQLNRLVILTLLKNTTMKKKLLQLKLVIFSVIGLDWCYDPDESVIR